MSRSSIELLPANDWSDLPSIGAGMIRTFVRPEHAVESFERAFAEWHGGGHAFAFGAGRVALAAILDALDIGPGDEVILPAYTCVAVPNPILFRGCVPVYADIDRETLNLDCGDVARKITARTKAVIVQHTFGYPMPLAPIRELIAGRQIAVIEDCTHATGARYDGAAVGTKGDAAFYSSEQTKVISTGAGGIVLARDAGMAARIAQFQRRCASVKNPDALRMLGYAAYLTTLRGRLPDRTESVVAYYLRRVGLMREPVTTDLEMRCIEPPGFLRRFPASLAPLGRHQVARLTANLERRRQIAGIYADQLADIGEHVAIAPGTEPAYVRYPLRVKDQRALVNDLERRGVQIGVWFSAPIHPEGVPQHAAG